MKTKIIFMLILLLAFSVIVNILYTIKPTDERIIGVYDKHGKVFWLNKERNITGLILGDE